jgi:actin-related protein 8
MQSYDNQITPLWAKFAVKGIVVFEFGSFNLRYGLVSRLSPSSETSGENGDEEPMCFSIPHCIAWRKKVPSSSVQNITNYATTSDNNDIQCNNKNVANDTNSLRNNLSLTPYVPTETIETTVASLERLFNMNKEDLPQSNIGFNVEIIPKEKDNFEWADISNDPPYIVGEDALFLDPSDPYEVFFPIKYGHFNINGSDGKRRPRHLILNDLQTIWEYVITQRLGLKLNDLKEYCVAFAISDVFDKREVKDILNIFLNNMRFRAAFIQKASVCAAIGAGHPSACVVDIGFSKTNIACVDDDGNVIPGTAFHFHYGGVDISRFFLYLLQNHQKPPFPYTECDLRRISDLLIVEEMKETCCHLNKADVFSKLYEFCVRQREKDTKLFRIQIDKPQFLAPLALFDPHAFGPLTPHETPLCEYDSEDFMDEIVSMDLSRQFGLIQPKMKPKPKYIKKKDREQMLLERQQEVEMIDIIHNESVEENDESDSSVPLILHEDDRRRATKLKLVIPDELIDHTFPVSVPQAIVESIGNVTDKSLRRTLFSHIVLTGASSQFEGLADLIEERVFYMMPREIETVDVLSFSQFRDPKNFVWNGVAILSKLALTSTTLSTENFNYWITNEEWQIKGGGRILREKLPFSWDCSTFNKIE